MKDLADILWLVAGAGVTLALLIAIGYWTGTEAMEPNAPRRAEPTPPPLDEPLDGS